MAGKGNDFDDEKEDGKLKIGRYLSEEERLAKKMIRMAMRSMRRGHPLPSRRAMRQRPSKDGATSFHFSHTNVSKSEAPRRSRVAVPFVLRAPPAWAAPRGRAALHQRYIEGIEPVRPDALERDSNGEKVSFGNLADKRDAREDFWEAAERRERVNGRVQCRIIVELPHEMSADQRKAALRDFCARGLEAKRLPYWAVVHRPDPTGDQRNFHAHIVYYDRPGERSEDGQWRFDKGKGRARYPWGTESPVSREKRLVKRLSGAGAGDGHVADELRAVREFINSGQQPDRAVQVEGWLWIKGLRKTFSGVMNEHLALAEQARRYDPRRYVEMGIEAPPGRHLGPARAALERRGEMTDVSAHEVIRREVVENEEVVAFGTAATAAARREIEEMRRWPSEEAVDERRNAEEAFLAWSQRLEDTAKFKAYLAKRRELEEAAAVGLVALALSRARNREKRDAAGRERDRADMRHSAAVERVRDVAQAHGLPESEATALVALGRMRAGGDGLPVWNSRQRERFADPVLAAAGVAVSAEATARRLAGEHAAIDALVTEGSAKIEEIGGFIAVAARRRRKGDGGFVSTAAAVAADGETMSESALLAAIAGGGEGLAKALRARGVAIDGGRGQHRTGADLSK